jgi:5-methyltetrahydrofolate--homocysteine methyltransferase
LDKKTIEVDVSSLHRLTPTWNCFKYPAILTDDVVGEATSFCRCAGNVKVILKEKKLTAKGIYGIFSGEPSQR